jgi:hypothetical protein
MKRRHSDGTGRTGTSDGATLPPGTAYVRLSAFFTGGQTISNNAYIDIKNISFKEKSSIVLNYNTKNGFNAQIPLALNIQNYKTSLSPDSSTAENYSSNGAIIYKYYSGAEKLQKKNIQNKKWETLEEPFSYNDRIANETGLAHYYDYAIENETEYSYRKIIANIYAHYLDQNLRSKIKASFDDIFLSDTDTMLAVRYNPNISGYKYVTQEAITNTLGGKYPVIRKNGDTRYRQFSLSGTLYMNASKYDEAGASTSVVWQNYSDFFDHLGEQPSLYVKDLTRLKGYTNKDRLERQVREIAIDFLTNNSIKLFRSPTEGNMIVYLSGVSFTPNKQSGRNVYDFSCTVTEVCEYNMENIKKYNLNDGREFKEATKIATAPSGGPVTVKGV